MFRVRKRISFDQGATLQDRITRGDGLSALIRCQGPARVRQSSLPRVM